MAQMFFRIIEIAFASYMVPALLLPAVWFDDFRQLITQYGQQLASKVIIDPTNPTTFN